MKKMKTLICAALLVAGLCGCKKIDVNKLEGTWSEQYDPMVFAMDGSVEYTFDGSNHYQMHVYDVLSGESRDYSGTYAIDLFSKGTITINPIMDIRLTLTPKSQRTSRAKKMSITISDRMMSGWTRDSNWEARIR